MEQGIRVRRREGIKYVNSLGRESGAVKKYAIEITYCNFITMGTKGEEFK